jgi:hypothetical protein
MSFFVVAPLALSPVALNSIIERVSPDRSGLMEATSKDGKG